MMGARRTMARRGIGEEAEVSGAMVVDDMEGAWQLEHCMWK
jgi:hypothetical protein